MWRARYIQMLPAFWSNESLWDFYLKVRDNHGSLVDEINQVWSVVLVGDSIILRNWVKHNILTWSFTLFCLRWIFWRDNYTEIDSSLSTWTTTFLPSYTGKSFLQFRSTTNLKPWWKNIKQWVTPHIKLKDRHFTWYYRVQILLKAQNLTSANTIKLTPCLILRNLLTLILSVIIEGHNMGQQWMNNLPS